METEVEEYNRVISNIYFNLPLKKHIISRSRLQLIVVAADVGFVVDLAVVVVVLGSSFLRWLAVLFCFLSLLPWVPNFLKHILSSYVLEYSARFWWLHIQCYYFLKTLLTTHILLTVFSASFWRTKSSIHEDCFIYKEFPIIYCPIILILHNSPDLI